MRASGPPARLPTHSLRAPAELRRRRAVGSELRIMNSICCIVPGRAVVVKTFLPDTGDSPERNSSVVFYLPVML